MHTYWIKEYEVTLSSNKLTIDAHTFSERIIHALYTDSVAVSNSGISD